MKKEMSMWRNSIQFNNKSKAEDFEQIRKIYKQVLLFNTVENILAKDYAH